MQYTEFPILFEDEHLLLINKPSGILSHPNPINEKKRLEGQKGRAAFLGHYDFDQRTFDTPKGTVWLLHRLDQEASGVLLAAKSAAVAVQLRLLFEKQSLQKIYHVLVGGGRPTPVAGKWRDHLEVKRRAKMRRAHVKEQKSVNAILHYTLLEHFDQTRTSLLAIKLITGKLHQIRVQSAMHGHPVAGDKIYGDFKWNRLLQKMIGLKRLFLHAASLAFEHPVTKAQMKIDAPFSPEIQFCLERIRKIQVINPPVPRNLQHRKWTPPPKKKRVRNPYRG